MITGLDYETAAATQRAMRCGECGSGLLAPHLGGGEFAVRCLKDPSHEGIARPKRTKKLADGKEYDVMTQRPVDENQALAIPQDLEGMVGITQKAVKAGKFPEQMTPVQVEAVARLAIAMGVNPLLGHIMIYQGKPMIGIDGRRTKDLNAGHHPSIRFRPMNREERRELEELGAVNPQDIVRISILTTEWGNTVEGTGRVLARERDPNQKGAYYLPTIHRAIEMAEKRAESRARRMAYGDMVPVRPEYLEGITPVEEGDVVEGQWQDLDTDTGEIREPQESDTGDPSASSGETLFPPDEGPDAPPENLPNSCSSMVLLQELWAKFGWTPERVEAEVLGGQKIAAYIGGGDNAKGKMTNQLYQAWRRTAGV